MSCGPLLLVAAWKARHNMFNFWVYPHLRKMKLPKNSWLNASLCQSVTEILFEVSAWFWDKYLASGTTLAQIATPMVSRGCQMMKEFVSKESWWSRTSASASVSPKASKKWWWMAHGRSSLGDVSNLDTESGMLMLLEDRSCSPDFETLEEVT